MANSYGENWESLIKFKTRPAASVCKIEDPVKRNQAEATKRWRKKNYEHYQQKQKEWRERNPDKIKEYQERNKKNIKRWAEEHPERIRELGRKNDQKRRQSQKRIEWIKAYRQTEEYKERRRELDRKRNQTPERKAYEKERSRRRAVARRLAKAETEK